MGEGNEDVGEDDGVVGVDRRHTMIARAAFQRHWEREPPSFLFFHGLPLDGRRVPPLVHVLHGVEGRDPL